MTDNAGPTNASAGSPPAHPNSGTGADSQPGDHPREGVEAHGGWSAVLRSLIAQTDLDPAVAAACIRSMLSGTATSAQIAGVLVGLRAKGESPAEVSAMVDAMLEMAVPIHLTAPDVIDIVGTGGSARRQRAALNVSTAASMVAAAAGAKVVKHGNRKASSTSGSTDVLDALGIAVELDAEGVATCLEAVGVAFAFARQFHPAMRHVGPTRAELGVPTVFNLLGPLSHPGRVRRGVIGIGDPARFELVAATLAARAPDHMWVVHGLDGLDELSTGGETSVTEIKGTERTDFVVHAAELDIEPVPAERIRGGDPEENAAIILDVFSGVASPEADLIVLNAAAGLVTGGVCASLPEGIAKARAAIAAGEASKVLEGLRATTHRLAWPGGA